MDRKRGQSQVDLQCANGPKSIQVGHQATVSYQVVNATITNDGGGVHGGLFQSGIFGEVPMEDMDIATVAQLCRHLLLDSDLVTNHAND